MHLSWIVIWLFTVRNIISERVITTFSGDTPTEASHTWTKGSYSSRFTNAINQTGTAFLELHSRPDEDDGMQAYKAGYSEGFLTRDLIYLHWRNTVEGTCDDKKVLCERTKKFMATNIKWMSKEAHRQKDDPYWYQVGLILRQLAGLTDGYNNATKDGDKKLSYHEFFWLNSGGDLGDIFSAVGTDDEKHKHPKWFEKEDHCSVLIKTINDNSDLYFAHDSWESYQAMLRIMKKYSLSFHETKNGKIVNAAEISMSSYPGMLSSLDDFYLTSSGLAVTETTIGNYNDDLWKRVKPVGQLLTWMRAVIATRLADSGLWWCRWYRRYNSGTYNNQWMVVDYNKFTRHSSLPSGTFWVLEQMPGYIRMEDKTSHLNKYGYWASYNVPYYENIFNMTGNEAMVEKYGDLYSYSRNPRARIFRRDHGKVNDVQSMIKLMRYNDYKHDPLSRCKCDPPYSGELAISARCDLNPKNGTYPVPMLAHRSHGGVDMKFVNSERMRSLGFIVISGPTWDPLPPFAWSTADFKDECPHYGHPDVWTFPPVDIHWSTK